jgi:hypothetical protein
VKLPALPRVLLRRWYVTLPGLIFVAAISVLTASKVPPKYQANSYVLLLPPASSVGPGGNQFLALGGLEATTDVLARAMSDIATVNALQAEGVGPSDYVVVRDASTSGPVLQVTTTDKTAAQALADNALVVVRLAPTLAQLQQSVNVNPIDQVTAKRINQAREATVQLKSQLRALLVVIALGLILVIIVAALVDGPMSTRAERRRSARSAEDDGENADQPEEAATDDIAVDLTSGMPEAELAPVADADTGVETLDHSEVDSGELGEQSVPDTDVQPEPEPVVMEQPVAESADSVGAESGDESNDEATIVDTDTGEDNPVVSEPVASEDDSEPAAAVAEADDAAELTAESSSEPVADSDDDNHPHLNGAESEHAGSNGSDSNGTDSNNSDSDGSAGSSFRRRLVRGTFGG